MPPSRGDSFSRNRSPTARRVPPGDIAVMDGCHRTKGAIGKVAGREGFPRDNVIFLRWTIGRRERLPVPLCQLPLADSSEQRTGVVLV